MIIIDQWHKSLKNQMSIIQMNIKIANKKHNTNKYKNYSFKVKKK